MAAWKRLRDMLEYILAEERARRRGSGRGERSGGGRRYINMNQGVKDLGILGQI